MYQKVLVFVYRSSSDLPLNTSVSTPACSRPQPPRRSPALRPLCSQDQLELFVLLARSVMAKSYAFAFITIYNYNYPLSKEPIFSNLANFYRIYNILPVSSASAERRFSILKQIKSYTRSTMDAIRLSDLSVLNIENEFSENLDFNNVVDTFAKVKNSRK